MRILCFFGVLCVMSGLLCGFNRKECDKWAQQVSMDGNLQFQLKERAIAVWPNNPQEAIQLMRESRVRCQRALDYCQRVLEKIGKLSKSDRQLPYWRYQKKEMERNLDLLTRSRNDLQQSLSSMEGELLFQKALPWYQKSQEKAQQALIESEQSTQWRYNLREWAASLERVQRLYEEAVVYAQQSLEMIAAHPEEQNWNTLQQMVAAYQEEACRYQKEARGLRNLMVGKLPGDP